MEIRCNNQTSGWSAIQAAIDALPMEGGTVVIPSGSWRSGPIRLRSNLELHLEDGADVYFNEDLASYPLTSTRFAGIDCVSASPLIAADHCTNVAITGCGTFHFREEAFVTDEGSLAKAADALAEMVKKGTPVSGRVFEKDLLLPPPMMQFSECRNIRCKEFTIDGAPRDAILALRSEGLAFQGVTVRTYAPYSGGIVLDSCAHVVVEGCHFSSGDDCIMLSAGAMVDFAAGTKSLEDVTIRRCYFTSGRNAVHLGPESAGGVHSIHMRDSLIYGTLCGICFTSVKGHEGSIRQVLFDGLQINQVREAIHINCDENLLSIRDVSIENITGSDAQAAVSWGKEKDDVRSGIALSNVHVDALSTDWVRAIG